MTLEDLGTRICIMGPSNSGKSTLAAAIARKCALQCVHLDQLFHLPNTDWKQRPFEVFAALHEEAVAGESWVIEGNYSRLLSQRLERATGLILLDLPTTTSLFRYLRRSWFEQDRIGGLEGGKDSVKWIMIRHIAITTRQNRRDYRNLFRGVSMPKIRLSTGKDLAQFYRTEGLQRVQGC